MSQTNTLKKSDLIDAIHSHESLEGQKVSKKMIDAVLNEIFAAIKAEVAENNTCIVNSFGTFSVRERAARKGKVPGKDTVMEIPASRTVGLKVSKILKDKLKAKFEGA